MKAAYLMVVLALLPKWALLMRFKIADEMSVSTGSDIIMCDKMCMQCPDGRNILILRQKSPKVNTMGIVAGALSFGVGWGVVTTLYGCDKIGFEFWVDRVKQEEQPLASDSFMGVAWIHSGLEKLNNQTTGTKEDVDALEACSKLVDTYAWSAVRGAFAGELGQTRQQRFARMCLTHSMLCGPTGTADADLHVNWFNPFVHEDMCSPPPAKSPEDQRTDDIAAFGQKYQLDGESLEELSAQSSEVQDTVMVKFEKEPIVGNVKPIFLRFIRKVVAVAAWIPTFKSDWGLDDDCIHALEELSIDDQERVKKEFSSDEEKGSKELKRVFLNFLESIVLVNGRANFITAWGLDEECDEELANLPDHWQQYIMIKFDAGDEEDKKKLFMVFLNTFLAVQQQLPDFVKAWNLDQDCEDELALLLPKVQLYIIQNFKPEIQKGHTIKPVFMQYLKEVSAEMVGTHMSTSVESLSEADIVEEGSGEERHFVKSAPADAVKTVVEAGKAIEMRAKEDARQDWKLSDGDIGRTLRDMCTTEEQLERCRQENINNARMCQDKCCWLSCGAFAKSLPSCTKECVKPVK